MLTASGLAPTLPTRTPPTLGLDAAQSDLLAGHIGRALTGFAAVLATLDGRGGEHRAGLVAGGAGRSWADAPVLRAVSLAGLVEGRLARGDLEAAAAACAEAVSVASGSDRHCRAVATWARGEVAAAHGDVHAAADLLLSAGRLLVGRDAPGEPALLPWRISAALALTALGERAEAVTLAQEHLALARAAGSPHATAQALRVLAVTDLTGRREQLLRTARAALDGVVADRLAAQIDTDLAGLLVLGLPGGENPSRHHEALLLLRGAERYAAAEGLAPLRGRAGRLLERTVAPIRRSAGPAADDPLSVAQRRVAELAADGLTNREVAVRLGVSVKAVEWHLSRVYRRLGIASRRDLAAWLG